MSPNMNVVMARITVGMMSSPQAIRGVHQSCPPIPDFQVPITLHPSGAHDSASHTHLEGFITPSEWLVGQSRAFSDKLTAKVWSSDSHNCHLCEAMRLQR